MQHILSIVMVLLSFCSKSVKITPFNTSDYNENITVKRMHIQIQLALAHTAARTLTKQPELPPTKPLINKTNYNYITTNKLTKQPVLPTKPSIGPIVSLLRYNNNNKKRNTNNSLDSALLHHISTEWLSSNSIKCTKCHSLHARDGNKHLIMYPFGEQADDIPTHSSNITTLSLICTQNPIRFVLQINADTAVNNGDELVINLLLDQQKYNQFSLKCIGKYWWLQGIEQQSSGGDMQFLTKTKTPHQNGTMTHVNLQVIITKTDNRIDVVLLNGKKQKKLQYRSKDRTIKMSIGCFILAKPVNDSQPIQYKII